MWELEEQSRPVETAFLLAVFLSPETSPPWHLCSRSSEMQPEHMEGWYLTVGWSVWFLASGRLLTCLRTALAQLLLRGGSAGGEAGGISGLPWLPVTFLFLARGSQELPSVSASVVSDSWPRHRL